MSNTTVVEYKKLTNLARIFDGAIRSDTTNDYLQISHIDGVFYIHISIHISNHLNVTDVTLYFYKCGDEIRLPLSLKLNETEKWTVIIKLENAKMLNPFSYFFKLTEAGGHIVFLDASGISKYRVSTTSNFKLYEKSAPSWLDPAVMYHVFVDSFCNDNNSKVASIEWSSRYTDDIYSLYGGNITGIISRLDHLNDLGVSILCLTPIFKSQTNHRYDVEDYFSVDNRLGGNKEFSRLCEECRNRGIKIVLDGVFNHISSRSNWFNKFGSNLDNAAYQSKDSSYFEYFCFSKHPEEYETFWLDRDLPKLNYRSSSLREVIYKGEQSVIKYWLSEPYCIDGWRIDASCLIARYLDSDFNSSILSELYEEVKNKNRDAYIFCENPFDPTGEIPYKNGDGITNYAGFYNPLLCWLDDSIDFDARDLEIALREFRALVGYQYTLSSVNFIGNHDKQRMLTILKGNHENYLTALAFLFTYPGLPCIYYGEEIGLCDLNSKNDSRISMVWEALDASNEYIFEYTKKLIFLYKNLRSINGGSFKALSFSEDIFIFERVSADEITLVILNKSDQVKEKIAIECFPLKWLMIGKLFSCLDPSLRISFIDDTSVIVENIINKKPIIISSVNPHSLIMPDTSRK
jgi:alpha-glucosidase